MLRVNGTDSSGFRMTNISLVTPSGKRYLVGVEGALCRELIHAFDEIEDWNCKSWIYNTLNTRITKSTPWFCGQYLGYIWNKARDT